jgi:uncharacterized protein
LPWAARSNNFKTFVFEHRDELDQRQADQRGWVVAHNAFDQRNAESFDFGAAGAIVGLFAREVALDLSIAEVAEDYRRRDVRNLNPVRSAVIETKRGVENDAFAAHRFELPDRLRVAARLVQFSTIQHCDLIRADDQRDFAGPRYRARLRFRQAQRGVLRRLARKRRFIHIRRNDVERQPQPLEQVAPVNGGRGEYEVAGAQVKSSKCLPNISFLSCFFDRVSQKYYHARLMFAQTVIDSLEFARAEQELRGSLPVKSLARLQDSLVDAAGSIDFVIKGSADAKRRPILGLEISGSLHLQCQRCLGLLDYPLRLFNTLRLVRQGENVGAEADDPEFVDFIDASSELDVATLIEDEILLSLPFAPRHREDTCQQMLGKVQRDARLSAFAKLAALRKN